MQENLKEEFEATKAAAEEENATPQAMCSLGWAYENAYGVEGSLIAAALWYRMAAERGHLLAQKILGKWYEIGRGVDRDSTKALIWYRKAAEQNDAEAQDYVGSAFFLWPRSGREPW